MAQGLSEWICHKVIADFRTIVNYSQKVGRDLEDYSNTSCFIYILNVSAGKGERGGNLPQTGGG